MVTALKKGLLANATYRANSAAMHKQFANKSLAQ